MQPVKRGEVSLPDEIRTQQRDEAMNFRDGQLNQGAKGSSGLLRVSRFAGQVI